MKGYGLADLPLGAQRALLKSHELKNVKAYRDSQKFQREQRATKASLSAGGTLFAEIKQPESEPKTAPVQLSERTDIIWGTDSYGGHGVAASSKVTLPHVQHIVPRSEKAKAEQKKRTKDKAEVFTPSWVCNLQNNLVDDEVLYEGAFNRADNAAKTWVTTESPVDFSRVKSLEADANYSWIHYVASRRLEITCGEGPYLMSRYDTVTGEEIPVRNDKGFLQRIGLLDRKFRVISENVESGALEFWLEAAKLALSSTYGYEWQGDNLLLARLSFLNTFVDYYKDFSGELPSKELLKEIAVMASWQLWQMDGLKMVTPMSCSDACKSCDKKLRIGHDGKLPLIRWGKKLITFEDFLEN